MTGNRSPRDFLLLKIDEKIILGADSQQFLRLIDILTKRGNLGRIIALGRDTKFRDDSGDPDKAMLRIAPGDVIGV